jgi:hypothetical protein
MVPDFWCKTESASERRAHKQVRLQGLKPFSLLRVTAGLKPRPAGPFIDGLFSAGLLPCRCVVAVFG